MTPAEAKNLRPMKGQPVKIEWRRPEDDWPYFHLLEVSPKDSALKLRGMDYPDCSAKHDGGVFWVDWVDVVRIVPLSANAPHKGLSEEKSSA